MISAFLAIYGALLSTLLAFIQIANIQRSRRFIEISIGRSFSLSDENLEFKISNRSAHKTEVQNIMIGICELSDTGHVALLSARGFEAYKTSHFWERDDGPIKLPFALNPGESVYVDFGSSDGSDLIGEDRSFLSAKISLANAFELEIEHSQGNPRRAYFAMDRQHLKGTESLRDVDKLSLLRSRIWKFSRPPN